jgi:hypothetical protein
MQVFRIYNLYLLTFTANDTRVNMLPISMGLRKQVTSVARSVHHQVTSDRYPRM